MPKILGSHSFDYWGSGRECNIIECFHRGKNSESHFAAVNQEKSYPNGLKE